MSKTKDDFNITESIIHEDMIDLMNKAVTEFYDKFRNLSDENLVRLSQTANALSNTNCWCCVWDRKRDFIEFAKETSWFRYLENKNVV